MKLNKWLYGAMALGMLAACSDKDVAPGSGGENGENKFLDGVNYLAVSLELPYDPETRADDGSQGDDNFDDGTANEYNVDNAALLLFKGEKNTTDGSDPEATAKFVGAYVINAAEAFDQPNGDNITVSFQKAIKVLEPPTISDSEQLWGLAIVNYKAYKNETDKGHFKIDAGENASTYGDLTIRTTTSTPNYDTDNKITSYNYSETNVTPVRLKNATTENPAATFADIRAYITDCNFLKDVKGTGEPGSIFMTNAPLSDKKGLTTGPTGYKIQTLAKLNNNFKSTETEAIQDPAGCIFVERAVAKVTCSEFPKFAVLTHTIVETSNTGAAGYTDQKVKLPITSVQWIIDNEEKTSYIVRNADTNNTWWPYGRNNRYSNMRYRFIGNAGMNDNVYDTNPVHSPGETTSTWYRTYWCIDPTYNVLKDFNNQADVQGASFRNLTSSSDNSFASGVPFYPHENTFDVQRQTYQNTTRVVFKVTYDNKGKIVTVDDNGNIVSEGADLTNCDLYAVRGELRSFYLKDDAENLFKKSVLGSPSLHTLIKDILAKSGLDQVNYDASDITISTSTASADAEDKDIVKGDLIVTSVSFTDSFWKRTEIQYESQTEAEADATRKAKIQEYLNKIVEDANSDYHIVPFTGNTCYYAVYIQHFGDTYCKLPTKTVDGKVVDDWSGTTTTAVYNNSENDYLGRYGLVRNNWYDLAIGKIAKLGRATVPGGKVDTSDDNNVEEWYLSARIHVLSWAKRTQHHDF